MKDRRRFDRNGHHERWPWWRRVPCRLADWFYRFALAPFMTKVDDGTILGSMTRWAVFLFTLAMTTRLVPQLVKTPGGWVTSMAPLNAWDVIETFVILYALGIDKAINSARPKEVLDLLGRVIPGGGGATQSVTTPEGTTLTQTVESTPPKVAPETQEPG